MARRKTSQRSKAKTILRLPDLEQSKNAVLHSLAATTGPLSNSPDPAAMAGVQRGISRYSDS
jgi:hypothetical protein